MKYQQHPFATIRRIAPLWVIAALLLGSCSKDAELMEGHNNPRPSAPLIIRSTIAAFTRTDSGTQTRTPLEDGTPIRFQAGDAIGLFAVTGIGTSAAAIADGINNTRLTYTPSSAGHTPPAGALGSWTPPAGTDLAYNPDATYIAYYPYKAGITIDLTKSKEEIIASFADNPALQPGTDQSTAGKYAASDLMTASGKPTVAPTGEMVLSLKFTHSYTLLVVMPQLKLPKYVAPNNKFKYHKDVTLETADLEASEVMILGVKAYKFSDGNFRAIVKPSAIVDGNVNGNYITHGAKIEYGGVTSQNGVPGGSYFTCTVNATLPSTQGATTRALQVGDFLFKDGSIWPGGLDGAGDPAPPKTSKDGSMGVVFWVGDPTATDPKLKEDYPHCTNGLVLYKAVGGGNGKWSESTSSIDYWLKSSLKPNDFNAPAITATDVCQGYSNTKSMEKFITSSNINGIRELNILTVLNNSNAPNNVVSRASKWYIPSMAEAKLIINGEGNSSGIAGRELIDGQLKKIYSATTLSHPSYLSFWLNTEEVGTKVDTRNVAYMRGDDGTVAYQAKRSSFSFRFILAF